MLFLEKWTFMDTYLDDLRLLAVVSCDEQFIVPELLSFFTPASLLQLLHRL